MAWRATINDLSIDLLQNVVSRLPALSFAYADCVSRSWNHACHLALCRPKLSSACSFNPSLQVAIEEVVKKVLSEPIRPQFAIAATSSSFDLQEAIQLITAKLGSKVPFVINHSSGVIGRDVISDEFKETEWSLDVKGIMLTVGFVPGLKVKSISLKNPYNFMIKQFITDIREFSTSISGCPSPAAIMIFGKEKAIATSEEDHEALGLDDLDCLVDIMDFAMSPETIIVGACSEDFEHVDDVAAVALVFVKDKNKPPGTGETRFHAVLSSGLSPVGPTYKVVSVDVHPDNLETILTGVREGPPGTFGGVDLSTIYTIGVTKRWRCSIMREEAKWMTSLSYHTFDNAGGQCLCVPGVGFKIGDTYQYYCKDSNIARSTVDNVSNLLRSLRQTSTNDSDKWEVFGGLIFASSCRGVYLLGKQNADSSAFLESFPGVTLAGTICDEEIGRGYLLPQEQKSARACMHRSSAVYLIMSYSP
ncbi:hypothetical protein QVD17_02521 [Tagetes erecta]|uniref:F-box domain-containing protein n=1 Tax=Tagetes erecta TaxID=13708 RepID=A0AAD8L6R2_TARER|nr:hypothetical protein QVD17_02521 [Tagetes erecta]